MLAFFYLPVTKHLYFWSCLWPFQSRETFDSTLPCLDKPLIEVIFNDLFNSDVLSYQVLMGRHALIICRAAICPANRCRGLLPVMNSHHSFLSREPVPHDDRN